LDKLSTIEVKEILQKSWKVEDSSSEKKEGHWPRKVSRFEFKITVKDLEKKLFEVKDRSPLRTTALPSVVGSHRFPPSFMIICVKQFELPGSATMAII